MAVGKSDEVPERDARKRLMSSALKVFTKKGYAATTVRELVAEAGVTKPVLYYYYKNKEGIFLELFKTQFANIDSLFLSYQNGKGDIRGRFLALFDKIFLFVMENKDFLRLMHSLYYGPPQGAPFFDCDTYFDKYVVFISQFVKEGMQRGEFKKGNATDMAWIITGVVHYSVDDQISFKDNPHIDRKVFRRLLNHVLDSMALYPKKAGR